MIVKTSNTILSNDKKQIDNRLTELGIYDHVQRNIPENNAVMFFKEDVFIWCSWSKSFLHIRTSSKDESKLIYDTIEKRFLRARPPAKELMH